MTASFNGYLSNATEYHELCLCISVVIAPPYLPPRPL